MKPLIYNDILAAVACVSGREDALSAARDVLCDAECADRYRRSHGRAHPVLGDGSLMAAALRHQRHGDTSFASAQGRSAWIAVLEAVQAHLDQPEAQPIQRVAAGSNSSRFGAISSPQSSQ